MPVATDLRQVHSRFSAVLQRQPCAAGPIGLAVSGGGDSIAMMHLAARALPADQLRVVTVNHGLRADAADEIAEVSRQAALLSVHHTVLNWTWDRTGNLQAAARAGRWTAIADWTIGHQINTVFLGHTEDDQVETLLMRLARGSGIDGLTAMARADYRDGLRVVRPLLDISRDVLRDWLTAEKIKWCDDPSNDDPRFDRVRARQMFAKLEELGLTRKRLLQTIDHMQAAHKSLQIAAQDFARTTVRQDAGDLIFHADALDLGSMDAPRRVMAAGFLWVSGNMYRPRFDRLLEIVEQVRKGQTSTLGGCLLSPMRGGGLRMTREPAATKIYTVPERQNDATGAIWDRRWFVEGALDQGMTVRALGDGIRHCPDWREVDIPRTSLLASPSVWSGETLISAPVAGFSSGFTARIVADFHEHAFAH